MYYILNFSFYMYSIILPFPIASFTTYNNYNEFVIILSVVICFHDIFSFEYRELKNCITVYLYRYQVKFVCIDDSPKRAYSSPYLLYLLQNFLAIISPHIWQTVFKILFINISNQIQVTNLYTRHSDIIIYNIKINKYVHLLRKWYFNKMVLEGTIYY